MQKGLPGETVGNVLAQGVLLLKVGAAANCGKGLAEQLIMAAVVHAVTHIVVGHNGRRTVFADGSIPVQVFVADHVIARTHALHLLLLCDAEPRVIDQHKRWCIVSTIPRRRA